MAPARVAVLRWENVSYERIEAYWERLRGAGLDPVDLHDPSSRLDDVRGLVLTGGVDIDPARYGEAPHPRAQAPDPARDEFELGLLDAALRRDLPVLAICRGHQLLNVCLGAGLLQHIEDWSHASQRDEERTSATHAVAVETESRLATWLGAGELVVNSRHHQGVVPQRLAAGLRVAALSPDGIVEAVESERHAWVIGVQWHPERDEPQINGFAASGRRLFAALAEAVNGAE